MTEKHLQTAFQARYYVTGGPGAGAVPNEVWFVLHGQGHLAKYFLKKFGVIFSSKRKIIAPEGLSRYYLDGFYGRVGSTWMTKEDRLTDISNYIEFLTRVYRNELPNPGNCKVTLLGFSQGAATASRWVVSNQVRFDRLILWAGLFPSDLDIGKGKEVMRNMEILNIHGDRDEYLTDEKSSEQFSQANQLDVSLKTITFHGGHEIDPETLKNLI